MRSFRVRIIVFLSLFNIIHIFSQEKEIKERPKLVIQVIIEQMRYDLIHRYWDKFSDKGFKRLINNGTYCSNAYYDYIFTESAPGFATISTGSNPSEHGIISNKWYVSLTGKEQFCIDDAGLKNDSEVFKRNSFSSKFIIGSTIGDELRMSNYKQSKVIGVSLKNYGAILSSGNLANAAYWMDIQTGNWTSSSFYMDSIPTWVKKFNDKEFAELYLKREWAPLYAIGSYNESLSDNNSYETGFIDKIRTFPYKISGMGAIEGTQIIKATPFGNTYTIDFSIACILNENLGKDQYTDFLSIDFATPGFVYELFGLHSIELEDIYLRLDKDLAHLLEFIDDYLGKDNVLIFVTSDRGAADNPDYLREIGMPVGKFNPELAISLTESYLKATYGQSGWIKHYSAGQIYLNQYFVDVTKVDPVQLQLKTALFMNQFKGVAKTTTASILQTADSASGILQKFRNSYNIRRSGDILLCLEPGYIEELNSKGNNFFHQTSPYRYDSHVPLIFYGWKIKKDEIFDPIPMQNIAPTISRILNISYPSNASGKPIEGIFIKNE